MPIYRWITRLRGVAVLVVLGFMLAGLGWWASRDSWPALVTIPYPYSQADMLAPRFSVDGRLLLMSTVGGVRAWSLATGQPVPPPAAPIILAPSASWNRSPVLSHDRRSYAGIVEPSPLNQEIVWVDVASGRVRARFAAGAGDIRLLAFGAEDRSLRAVVIEADRSLTLATWNLATGAEVRRPFRGFPRIRGSLTISPDARLLAVVLPNEIGVRLWDLQTDSSAASDLATPTTRVSRTVNPTFASDGNTLFVPRQDQQIEVWDLATNQLIRLIPCVIAGQTMTDLAVAPDGKTLAVGTMDQDPTGIIGELAAELYRASFRRPSRKFRVVLIDAASGQMLARASDAHSGLFTPDGQFVVILGIDETLSIRAVPSAIRTPQ